MRDRSVEKRVKEVDTRLNLVLHNGKFRLYATKSAAYLAAKQLGGDAIAISTYVHYYDFQAITEDTMKSYKNYRNKYNAS